MMDVAVTASTVRVRISGRDSLRRLINHHADYIAIIIHGDSDYMVVYDTHTLVSGSLSQVNEVVRDPVI